MNYLHQLKQSVEQRKAQEQAEQQLRKQQEERFIAEVKPALETLHSYLHELTQQLNYLKPLTPVVYEIKEYGKLELLQQDYRVLTHEQHEAQYKSYDNPVRNRKDFAADRYNFFLRCHCVGPYKIRIEKRKIREVNGLREYLVRHSLKFTCTEDTDDKRHLLIKAVFIVEPLLPVEFNFTGNLATCDIDLTVKNFLGLGEKRYTLVPQTVNDAFLDELARYITRQPNTLSLPEKVSYKQYPLSPKQKDLLQFELWLHNAQRELGEPPAPTETTKVSHIEDCAEFEAWLRHQEDQMAKTPVSPKQPPILFQLLKKVKLFKTL